MREVKVGMYFPGGTIWKYLQAKQSFDSNTNSSKNQRFFKDIKMAMKCALIIKYCFRNFKIDSKDSFPLKYHDSGHFLPNDYMLKNVNFRYFCEINILHIVQYKV